MMSRGARTTIAALQAVMLVAICGSGCDLLWPLETPFSYERIAAGTFKMGSRQDELCHRTEEHLHAVTLTSAFEISSIETTQGQFEEVMGYNPAYNDGCDELCPVEQVSWDEAAAYCNALSAKNDLARCYACSGQAASVSCASAPAYAGQAIFRCPGYRLPTEAEWEYAYRAGSTSAYYNGANSSCSGIDSIANRIGWYAPGAGSTQFPSLKQANAFNLFDMAGNVWEWCHDWYQPDLGTEALTDPAGPANGEGHVMRGGSWESEAETLRGAYRGTTTGVRRRDIGFRCVRSR